ncbi:hypothetical protein FRC05_005198 [Tulasnella sp. 425]|nr:hypothetical protein FRC05_005198 [Tulasnella sp. 425]
MTGGNMYSPKTQHGLQRLRNMTLEAAVPPTICVILNIGFYIGMTFNASTQDEDKTLSTGFQFANFQSSDCRCKQGDIEKAAVVLAVMPDPIRSSININQELVGHHAAARNARSSRGDPDDELV